MSHLFTLKARIVLIALLACNIAVKAQTVSDTVKSTTLAMVLDTPLTKKAGNTQLIKSDTTLVIRAGAKLVHKSDTTLVIDPDGTLLKKFNEEVAAKEKAEQAKNAANNTATKTDSALAKPATTTQQRVDNAASNVSPAVTTTPVVTAPLVVPTPVPSTDSSLPASQQSGSTGTQQATNTQPQATTTQQQAAPTQQQPAAPQPQNTQQQVAPPVVKADSATKQIVTNDQPAATQQNNNVTDQSVKKADSTVAVKIDTAALKKTDSLAAKKSDTIKFATDTTQQQIKAQNAYLEFGGPGLAISANYDTRFHKERNGWGYRIGVGFFSSGGNTVFTVPFQVNYLIGEHSSFLELGAGTTFLNSTGTNVGNSKWEFDKITGFIATATIGYRYQPESRGINFRIGFVPILSTDGIIPAGGASIGFTFK